MIFSKTILSISTNNILTLSIRTNNIMTLSLTTLNISTFTILISIKMTLSIIFKKCLFSRSAEIVMQIVIMASVGVLSVVAPFFKSPSGANVAKLVLVIGNGAK